jgi:UDPglucose 6-dehydrogenase
MGTVKWDMVNPEMVIIGSCRGGSTPEAEELRKFYASFMENDPRYIVCTWEEAEGVKIFYNTFISAKLAIVNLIQDVAHTLGHMNTDVVTTALAESTQRITSSAYMKAGMGDGGPCHPRDNIALRYLTQRLELGYDLFGSITTARERQAERFAEWLTEYAMPVVILGTSYKPNVTARDGSFALLIGHYVQEKNGLVNYDSEPDSPGPFTYLLGHHGCFHDYPFVEGSVIADPWRECPPVRGCRVEWYGNNNR